ncbi:hypothetical protein ATG71_0521 [Bacillus sp. es.034]|nr:hypothetical protein ATG71_0521 [Bacillus sp. es.034]
MDCVILAGDRVIFRIIASFFYLFRHYPYNCVVFLLITPISILWTLSMTAIVAEGSRLDPERYLTSN